LVFAVKNMVLLLLQLMLLICDNTLDSQSDNKEAMQKIHENDYFCEGLASRKLRYFACGI